MVNVLQRKYSELQKLVRSNIGGHSFLVSTQELANIFGLTERRIQQLADEGMPRIEKGKWDLKACARFYIENLRASTEQNSGDTVVKEKVRLLKARSERAELDNERIKTTTVTLEEVKQEALEVANVVREELEAMPGRLTPEIASEEKPAAFVKNILEKATRQALNSIASRLETIFTKK